jgi:hypothetical protein
MAAATLMTVNKSQAGLRWSYDQCVSRYGNTISPNARMDDRSICCTFYTSGYRITAYFDTNVVGRIGYQNASGFDAAGVNDFLRSNCPGANWQGPQRDASDGSYRWIGIVVANGL